MAGRVEGKVALVRCILRQYLGLRELERQNVRNYATKGRLVPYFTSLYLPTNRRCQVASDPVIAPGY